MTTSPQATSVHVAKVRDAVENGSAVRSAIVASWRRSYFHHGISPDSDRKSYVLSQSELMEVTQRRDLLIHVARPIMEELFRSVGLSGFKVVLSDKNGVVIDELTNDGDAGDFRDSGLRMGSIWSEEFQGTNAIGSVAVEKRPMVVFKDEHFSCRSTGLTCIGAPIFDSTSQIIGVLDVTSARNDTQAENAKFLLPIVTHAASRIETEYFRAFYASANIVVADGYSKIGTPLLAADEDDLIIGANRAARKLLKLDAEHFVNPLPRRDLLNRYDGPGGLIAAERSAIRRAIARNGNNMSKAARELGVSRATFYRLLSKHQIRD